MPPIAEILNKQKERAQAIVARATELFRENPKPFFVAGGVGGVLFLSGTMLLFRHHQPAAPAAPQARPTASPAPRPAVAISTQAAVAVSSATKPAAAQPAISPKAAAKPAPVPAPPAQAAAPAEQEAAPAPARPKPHVNIKLVEANCGPEIGLLCNQYQDKPWSAVRCLRAHADDLMPRCTKALEPVDDGN